MCKHREETLEKAEVPASPYPQLGTKWVIKHNPGVYELIHGPFTHMPSLGNSETKYMMVRNTEDGTLNTITVNAFLQYAVPWTKPEYKISFDTLSKYDPCTDGLLKMCRVFLGITVRHSNPWKSVVDYIFSHGNNTKALGVHELRSVVDVYKVWKSHYGEPSHAELLFLAKALDLVPVQATQGPDAETLKRLLGIAE